MHNFILCGMQFGDEGKGTFVDFLSHKYDADWVIRYNGGSQASHTVTIPNGNIHKFSQLGSGMFNEKTKTFLSSNMVINLENLFREVDVFCETSGQSVEDVLKRIYISRDCLVVTPFHKLLNRMRELSLGENRRGSVGTGVSEVGYLRWYAHHSKRNKNSNYLALTLYEIFFEGEDVVRRKLKNIKDFVLNFFEMNKKEIQENCPENLRDNLILDINTLLFTDFFENLAKEYCDNARRLLEKHEFLSDHFYNLKPFIHEMVAKTDYRKISAVVRKQFMQDYTIIFEGAQGLLLDVKYGIKPNTTLLDTTINHAMRIIDRIERRKQSLNTEGQINVCKIGVAKAFYSRHGKGVFPTESNELNKLIRDDNQEETYWNGKIRFGWFDAVLFRYAQKINKVDQVYLSSVDLLKGIRWLRICNAYRYKGFVDDEFEKYFDYYKKYTNEIIVTDIKYVGKNISKYLSQMEPVYEYVNGYNEVIIEKENGKKDISPECKNYIKAISSLIRLPITLISYGPTREEKLFL